MNLSISCCAWKAQRQVSTKAGLWTNPPTSSIWLIAINPRRTDSIRTASSLPPKRTRKSLNLYESLLNPVCVLRHKASFVLLTSVDSTAIVTTGGKGGGRRREKKSFPFRCPVLLSLCVEWKDVLLRFQFSGGSIRTSGETKKKKKKSGKPLKFWFLWVAGLSVVTVMNNRLMYRPRTSSQQSNQV